MLSAPLSGRIQDQLNLDGYSQAQLFQILSYRRDLAFFAGVLPDEELGLVIDISSRTRNARHGIEIMLRAGMMTNANGNDAITAEFIRAAKTEVYPELRSDVFHDLKANELFAAMAIGRDLSRPGVISTTVNDSFEIFKLINEEYHQRPQSKATYRLCVNTLDQLGIISHAVSSIQEGTRGRRAKITLFDIPAQILVERIDNVLRNRSF
jgi:Cdc6-like AAA superfamily ATPase